MELGQQVAREQHSSRVLAPGCVPGGKAGTEMRPRRSWASLLGRFLRRRIGKIRASRLHFLSPDRLAIKPTRSLG
jgi:hypothetical protein